MDLFGDVLPGTPTGDPAAPEPERPPPPARAPRAMGRLDLADWDTPTPAPTSRRWMLLAAVAPWVVVAAILLSTPRAPGPDASGTPAPSTTSAPTPDRTPPPATEPGPDASLPAAGSPAEASDGTPNTLGAAARPTTRGEAVGLAAVVARSWLSTRPAGVSIEGIEPRPDADHHYVEHLVVESIDHPARGALVVVVRALVLPVEDDTYGTGRYVRLAVPVALDADRARPAGAPWSLAVDDELRVQAPTTTGPVDDPDLMTAAAEAVAAAGYRELSLTSLERTSGWAWIAHVEGRAPGQQEIAAHQVWLRSDVGRLVVAGTPPPVPGRPPSAPPTTPPSPSPRPDPEVTP